MADDLSSPDRSGGPGRGETGRSRREKLTRGRKVRRGGRPAPAGRGAGTASDGVAARAGGAAAAAAGGAAAAAASAVGAVAGWRRRGTQPDSPPTEYADSQQPYGDSPAYGDRPYGAAPGSGRSRGYGGAEGYGGSPGFDGSRGYGDAPPRRALSPSGTFDEPYSDQPGSRPSRGREPGYGGGPDRDRGRDHDSGRGYQGGRGYDGGSGYDSGYPDDAGHSGRHGYADERGRGRGRRPQPAPDGGSYPADDHGRGSRGAADQSSAWPSSGQWSPAEQRGWPEQDYQSRPAAGDALEALPGEVHHDWPGRDDRTARGWPAPSQEDEEETW
jgi:hypothetical protein